MLEHNYMKENKSQQQHDYKLLMIINSSLQVMSSKVDFFNIVNLKMNFHSRTNSSQHPNDFQSGCYV